MATPDPEHVAIAVAADECLRRGIVAALPPGKWVRPHVAVYRLDAPVAGRCLRAEDGSLLAAMVPVRAREGMTAPLVAASELAAALVVGTAAAGVLVGCMRHPQGRQAPVGSSPERLGLALAEGYSCEPEQARRVLACWYAVLGRSHDKVTVPALARWEQWQQSSRFALGLLMPPTTADWLLHHLGLDLCTVEGCGAPREDPMGRWCRHHAERRRRYMERLDEEDARRAAAEDEADARRWAERSVEFAPIPGLRFLDKVPADLEVAWNTLMALPPAKLLRLLDGRPGDTAELHTVREHLEQAYHRPLDAGRWRLPDDEGPNLMHVMLAVIWHRTLAVATWKPATDSERQRKRRQRQQEKVEAIYGGRCRACGGTRTDDVCPVSRLDLHHVAGDGGGGHREGNTDQLRRAVIAYYEEHGVPPPEIEMLCHACHQYQTRMQAAGCPWGDRLDVRPTSDGGFYDGEDYPEGLVHTVPVPAPSRRKLMFT